MKDRSSHFRMLILVNKLAKEENPTLIQAIAFGFKASCFRVKRTLKNINGDVRPFPVKSPKSDWPIIAESRTVLYSSQLGAEFALQAGKVHNLRIAARHLNGIEIDAGGIFSFWKHVPRPTRWQGFSKGRELREGCIIPSVGGGLCQISNALYDCALKAGLEIVERHSHSRTLPGSMAEQGRDATVFWNYVDLRFRSMNRFRIEVALGRGELIVRFRSETRTTAPSNRAPPTNPKGVNFSAGDPVESCETCGVTSCFRHPESLKLPGTSHTAWLVDAYWPEHNHYLIEHAKTEDWLFAPFPGSKYPWSKKEFSKILYAPAIVLQRSIASRRLAQQGAARQRLLLSSDEKLARSYARRIPATALHLVVSQNLLPFLWRSGALGGRTFDVLMTRLPLRELQTTLDQAAEKWPSSRTLSDFRADPNLLRDEAAALAEADHWITPHSKVAKLAGERVIQLDWEIPSQKSQPEAGGRLLFPASTLGRKGARELRELGLPITICGPILESADFWKGFEIEKRDFSLDGVAAVVLPAWVENQPRRLLQAIASGVPVIASESCGLESITSVTTIKTGDIATLKEAVEKL